MSPSSDTLTLENLGQKRIDDNAALEDMKRKLRRMQASVNQKRRRTHHQMILIQEKGGRCERCLTPKHPYIYDFHHRNPKYKELKLDRSSFGRKLEVLRAEADKCHLLCANCHRETHTFNDINFLEGE